MAILIDPARWPAHGTMFAHLVSDSSLAELHTFADRAGLSPRAFDRDHYDVPQSRRAELVALGATAVSGSELIRRLRKSGLRVPSTRRPDHARAALRHHWGHLRTALMDSASRLAGSSAGLTDDLLEDLLNRWSQPQRHYHDVTHLLGVLIALDRLTADPPVVVRLAAWFHDAVYEGDPGTDERESAALARRSLRGVLPATQVAEVARLIELTIGHDPRPGDGHGALLCDADLAILGADATGYERYRAAVRADYAHVSDPQWSHGRSAVLRRLLTLQPLFATERGRALWAEPARRNLRGELASLGHLQG